MDSPANIHITEKGVDPAAALLAGRNNDGMNSWWPLLLLAGRGGLGFGGEHGHHGGPSATEALVQSQVTASIISAKDVLGSLDALKSSLCCEFRGLEREVLKGDADCKLANVELRAHIEREVCEIRREVQRDGFETRALIEREAKERLRERVCELEGRVHRREEEDEIVKRVACLLGKTNC